MMQPEVPPTETTSLLHKDKIWNESNTTPLPAAIFNLIKTLFGAAMLSLPWAMAHSTFVPGIIGLLFSALYSFITSMFIVNACEVSQKFEYSALLEEVHPYWEITAAVILIYVTLSSCLSYVILIGDFITDGINGLNTNFRFNYDRQIYIAIVCIIILLPLSLLKKFDSLKASSFIGNIATLYCVVLAIGYAIAHAVDTDGKVGEGFINNDWDVGIFIVTNVCAKAFVAQYPIPPMYEQLRNRSVYGMRIVCIWTYIIVTIIYLLFAIAGYYLFGSSTQGDVLNSYPSIIAFTIARFAMALNVIGTYPLIFKSLLQTIEDKFFSLGKGSRYNFIQHPRVRTLVICIIALILMVIGIAIKDVGPVSSIEGAVTILGLVSLFPILMAWKIGRPNDTEKTYHDKSIKRLLYVSYLAFLLFIGIALGIGGIILQITLLGQ